MNANLDIVPMQDWIQTNGKPLIIAGPCSAETEEQVLETARRIKAEGYAHIMRAGVWKPRTRPGSFEGMGEPALKWLVEAKKETGATATMIYVPAKFASNAFMFKKAT